MAVITHEANLISTTSSVLVYSSSYVYESLEQLIKPIIFTISSRISFKNQLVMNFVIHAVVHV